MGRIFGKVWENFSVMMDLVKLFSKRANFNLNRFDDRLNSSGLYSEAKEFILKMIVDVRIKRLGEGSASFDPKIQEVFS